MVRKKQDSSIASGRITDHGARISVLYTKDAKNENK